MKILIVRRHELPWKTLSHTYKVQGYVAPKEYLPKKLPPGFPVDLPDSIDIWNREFGVDFFSVRHRLAEISQENLARVKNAEVCSLEDWRRMDFLREKNIRHAFCFVDEDDWFSPNLSEKISRRFLDSDAVRWADLVYNGELVYRPVYRLFPRLRLRLSKSSREGSVLRKLGRSLLSQERSLFGLPVRKLDFLFQTNNYLITGRFLHRNGALECVADHVEASSFFWRHTSARIKSLPRTILSVTNKHPCSATAITKAIKSYKTGNGLRAQVEEFVSKSNKLAFPKDLDWVKGEVALTRELFENVLR